MSITSSLYSGLSGLDNHATAMQVIGDNLANIQTTAFKSNSAHFEDVLGASLTGVTGGNQTGAGTEISSVDANFIQGSLETTGVGTDVAINGEGFFSVKDPNSGEQFYTRDGHFIFDNQGYYVSTDGYRVQGYLYDSTGTNLIENLSDIQINQKSMIPPKATGLVNMGLNLDASQSVQVWDPTNASGTSSFQTALTVYDSMGQSHQVQVYFTKTADQTWDWHAEIDGGDTQGGTPGTLVDYGSGTINFDASGNLTTAMPVTFYTGSITFANGSTPPATQIDFT